jgi:type IV secretory pathway TraG/TraD family ATPase VirD4
MIKRTLFQKAPKLLTEFARAIGNQRSWGAMVNVTPLALSGTAPFKLHIGTSTGIFEKRSHSSSIRPGKPIILSAVDAAKSIFISGGIGSGKTSCIITPLLMQFLDQECGGIIFDITGDFKDIVLWCSSQTPDQQSYHQRARNGQVMLIGPGHTRFNLIEGVSPKIAGDILLSALLLESPTTNSNDAFWIKTASAYMRNVLGLLSFVPEEYNLSSLYRYITEIKFRNAFRKKLEENTKHLNPPEKTDEEQDEASASSDEDDTENDADAEEAEWEKNLDDDLRHQRRLLNTYKKYVDITFEQLEVKTRKSVVAVVSQILEPFSDDPHLAEAFCSNSGSFNLDATTKGTIFLVDLPLSEWGLGGKVASLIIKLLFFNTMKRRKITADSMPVFFMCDEYQDLVSCNKNALSDLNFWSMSRHSKVIGIISAQSVTSILAAIGDRDLANTVLQNFRQRVCFQTEDEATMQFLNAPLGQSEVWRYTHTKSVTNTEGDSITYNNGQSEGYSGGADLISSVPPSVNVGRSIGKAWGGSKSTADCVSVAASVALRAVVDAQLIAQLQPRQAIALLNIDNERWDDVIICEQLFAE